MTTKRSITRRDWLTQTASAGIALGGTQILGKATMAGDASKPRIIDPHVHVWKNDPRFPWPAELKQPPATDALPETLLGLMDQHGVEKTVIVHVIYYRWDCRYAASVIRQYPEKFEGVCRRESTRGPRR